MTRTAGAAVPVPGCGSHAAYTGLKDARFLILFFQSDITTSNVTIDLSRA